MQPPKPDGMLDREFWLTTGIMGLITMVLLVTTIVMLVLGGVFLPFGFDSDLIAKVFSPQLLLHVVAIVVLLVGILLMYMLIRRRRLAK